MTRTWMFWHLAKPNLMEILSFDGFGGGLPQNFFENNMALDGFLGTLSLNVDFKSQRIWAIHRNDPDRIKNPEFRI